MGRPANLRINITSDSRQARQDVSQTTGEVGGQLDRLKQAGPAMAAAAALAIGAAIVSAFNEALNQGKITAKLGAQLGATPAEARKYGKAAGRMFAAGVGEDFQSAADSISATMRAGLLPTSATEKQVQKIATKVSDLASTFEQESSQVARAVAQMVKTGMADSSEEAFNVLTRGFQTGANAADDLLDTFSEYSTQFRKLGLDGQEAMGLITQGLKGGARDADTVADALKELSIRVVDGSKTTREGFALLGLAGEEMGAKFAKGGESAREALALTLERLNTMTDPVAKNAAAVALFGTKAEDLGAALNSLNPDTAVNALGQVAGASDRLGESLRDNAAARLEAFKRSAQQSLVEFMGGKVLPALERVSTYVRGTLGPVFDFFRGLLSDRVRPAVDAVRSGVDKVKDAFQRNRDKLQPLINLIQNYAVPAFSKMNEWLGKLGGYGFKALFAALSFGIDQLGTFVQACSELVAWVQRAMDWLGKLKAPSWLSKLGGVFSFTSRSTTVQEGRLLAPAALSRSGTPAGTQRASGAQLAGWVGGLVPMVVNVTIDGQQLQARIDRRVSRAMLDDGARFAAEGWM